MQPLGEMSARGEVCDVNGNCVDASEDETEFFRLITKGN